MKLFAKYPGKCAVCHEAIAVGAPIYWEKGAGAWHNACHGKPVLPKPITVPAVKANAGDFGAVYALFDVAAKHLKWPAIVLRVGDRDVKLHVSGPRSKRPGVVNVTDRSTKEWFGAIERDGKWYGRTAPDDVRAAVRELALDPAGVAKRNGRLTNRCCFCHLHLTDERSVAAGFGPICADHFGLTEAWARAALPAELVA